MEAAPAERAADVGWEPADWDATLHRQWRAEWHDVGVLLLLAGVALPLERVLISDRALVGWYLIALAWPLVQAALVGGPDPRRSGARGGNGRPVSRSVSTTRCATT